MVNVHRSGHSDDQMCHVNTRHQQDNNKKWLKQMCTSRLEATANSERRKWSWRDVATGIGSIIGDHVIKYYEPLNLNIEFLPPRTGSDANRGHRIPSSMVRAHVIAFAASRQSV